MARPTPRPSPRPAPPVGLRPRGSRALLLAVCALALAPAALASPLRPVGPPRPAAQQGLHGLSRRPTGDPSWRLPDGVRPLHYDIHIAPDLDGLFFIGSVDITLQVDKRVDKLLTLHADGSLRFSECTLDGEQVQHAPSRDGKDFINFMVPKALESDSQHVLHCDYSGKIFQDDKGFYLSKYKLKDGLTAVPVKLGVTQFEMTFARRALPCFDEPGYRATFALAITHRVEQSAISNTRPQLILPVNETHAQTTFEPTPAMAVYTLAWVVSQMPNVSSLDGTFHTYAPPKYINSTALSQAVGPQVLAGMEDYTGIPYALDKMDQVAVPDFNFGAMENWGLVTYRQGLLVSGAGSRATTNLSVTTTIAHELAHQWFGNLVTPSWWGHVWLSEAFAELFCYLMTDKINPEWKVLDKMPLMEMHDAFVEDSLVSAAPMTNENIFTPDEILDNFGSITYAKGSSVLRMLRDAMDSVSADSFQKGLQSYLSTMQESGVVKPDDLWTALESQGVAFPGGLTVTQLGKKWTEQAGYPLITVTRSGDSVTVTQERFLSSGEKPATPVSWPVPLTWRAQGADSVQRPFLTKDSDSVSGIPKDAAWVLFNVDQLGYYRVNYDDDGWQALISALRSDPGALSAPERAMLVDDALVLARAGRLPYATALSLLEYLSAERQYAPWAALAASIQHLSMQCRAAGDQDVLSKAFNKWLAGLTKKAFSTLDFESSPTDTFEDKLARSVVAQVAYEAANFEAVTQASLKYLDSTTGIALDPDTARLALCQGLADSKIDDVFRRFWEELEYSTDEMKRRDYTYALGCAPENFDLKLKTEILERLTTAPSDETAKIDARDLKALWKSLLASELGLTTAVKYVVANASAIATRRGDGELTTILTTLAAQIATKDNRDTLASLELPRFDAVLKNCLATVDANLAWREANLASITSYLIGDETTTPTGTTETTTPSGSTQTTQTTQPTQPTPAPTLPPAAYRLPTTVSPSGYRLHLTVAGFDTFEGSVTVDILPDDEDVTAIVMHASGLNISLQDVRVYETYAKDVVVDVTDVILSPEVEQVSIKLKSALQPGLAYSVDIKYTGSMRSDFTGLYHTTTGGRDMVGTRLYPAYARRVLPCFDEPHFRTPFSVSVLHDQGLVAVGSNKPPLRRGLRNAVVQDDFDVTTSIPTSQLGIYLVDYRALKHLDSDGLTVSGRQELLDAAKKSDMLSQAQGLVWWFGNASGVAAAPEHLNLLGVTSSFEDAVSAWGVVAMRESDMVNMDTSPSSGASEQNWLTQLSRSLAQIWFGGQVSADWWDSAWISQGFATFYQYSVPASLQPAWQLPYQLYTRAIAPALLADSFEGAHPLNADVSGAQDSIAIAHDVIASGKGGAVVQMLSHVLEGNGAFDEGVKSLFHDGIKLPHTIESADLLSAMEVAAKKLNADTKLPGGVSLKDAVSTWVDASGYPVVNVIRDYNAKTATISQERFLQHTPSQSPAGGAAWWVPLSYALREEYLSRGYTPKVPLKTWLAPDQTLNVDLASSDDWLLVNADRREFFRVNYDVRNWKKLEEYLREYPKLIEPVARAMLVDDALALSRAGRLDYAVALEFLDYLRLEEDLHPWEAARPGFQYLDAQLLGSRHEAVYKKWLLQLLERAVQEAGFIPDERDSHLQRLTRAVVTAWACDLGQDSCTRYAKRNFDAWITDPNGVGHDTLGAAVCVGLRQGDATTLKTVVAKLADVEDSAQRAAIISGLGCGGNVHALFDLTVRPGLQRGEPALLWGSATRFGPADLTQSLHCFTMMHRRVAARYGKDSIVDIARVLANRVTTQQQLDLLSPLVVDIDAGLLQGALLLARDNVAWREDNLDAVADVLYALTDTPDPDLPTTTSTSTSTTTPGTIPPGPTVTDPATATAGTTASAWTQPPTAATTANTLPTLEPKTVPPGPSPTDPATASTASGSTTWWSIPTTASTAPPTLPPLETTTSGPTTTPGAGTSSGPDTPPTPVPSTTPNSASALAASTALLLVALAAAVVN